MSVFGLKPTICDPRFIMPRSGLAVSEDLRSRPVPNGLGFKWWRREPQ
jgi:hypothetical protein